MTTEAHFRIQTLGGGSNAELNPSRDTFVFSNVHARERGHVHAHAFIFTHSTVVSVTTANQAPVQTPASYLATPLHFIVMLLKATTKKSWGGSLGGEKEKEVLKRQQKGFTAHSQAVFLPLVRSAVTAALTLTRVYLPPRLHYSCFFSQQFFCTCLFLCHSSSSLSQGAILVYQNHWGWLHLSSRNIKEDGRRLVRWIKKCLSSAVLSVSN